MVILIKLKGLNNSFSNNKAKTSSDAYKSDVIDIIIESGEKPTEIFAECGFSNYPSFFRAYRAFYGFSPKTRK